MLTSVLANRCPPIPVIENALPVTPNGSVENGSIVEYACATGSRRMAGDDAFIQVECMDETWEIVLPGTCERKTRLLIVCISSNIPAIVVRKLHSS